jgi:hypothetical protein
MFPSICRRVLQLILILSIVWAGSPPASAKKCIGLKKPFQGKCYYPEEIAKIKVRNAARKAQLTVTSQKDGAKVFFNGEKVGTTPWKSPLLKPGRYSIAVERANHRKVEQWVELKRGERRVLELNPSPKKGTVALTAKGSDGRDLRATVHIGKERLGDTPLTVSVEVGTYRVTLSDPAGRYQETSFDLAVKDEQTVSKDVVLQRPSPRRIKSNESPGMDQDTPLGSGVTKKTKQGFGAKGRLFVNANAGLGLLYLSESLGGSTRSSNSFSVIADLRIGFALRERTALYLVASVAPSLTDSQATGQNSTLFPALPKKMFPFFGGFGISLIGQNDLNDLKTVVSVAVGVMGVQFQGLQQIEKGVANAPATCDASQSDYVSIGATDCETLEVDVTKVGFGILADLTYPIERTDNLLLSVGLQFSLGVVSTMVYTSSLQGQDPDIQITNVLGTLGGTLSLTYF